MSPNNYCFSLRLLCRFLTPLILSGAVHGWALARAADPPAHPQHVYWTFWAPVDFMDLLGTESSGDPFASGGDPPPQPSPPPPAIWKENLGFFEVGSVEDASPVLVAAGIPWDHTEDVAFLHKEEGRLYVRCSREAAELVDELMQGVRPSPTQNIEIEVLLIGLTDPGAYRTLAESEDARTAAESLATDRVRIVARALILTKSGQRASLGQGRLDGAESAKPIHAPPTAEGTGATQAPAPLGPGLSLQAEAILGVDGATVDLSVDLRFGYQVAPGDVAPLTGGLNTSVTVRSGRPVLQRLSLEGAPWPEVALVLSATVKRAEGHGWKNGVRQLLPREQEWRELGAHAAEEARK